jgi:hypothetical protein
MTTNRRRNRPTVDPEEAREIEGLLAFANDPGTIADNLSAQHKAADARMGRDWNSPQGCGCAACRMKRGTV